MDIRRYARNLNDALQFNKTKNRSKTKGLGTWVDTSTGRFVGNDLPDDSDEDGFKAAIEADPLNPTHHFVYSDYLRDKGKDHSADFHKALGEWLPEGLAAARGGADPGQYPWAMQLAKWTGSGFTQDPVLPGGITPEHLPGYPEFSADHRSRDPVVPVSRSRILSWDSPKKLKAALERGFFRKLADEQLRRGAAES